MGNASIPQNIEKFCIMLLLFHKKRFIVNTFFYFINIVLYKKQPTLVIIVKFQYFDILKTKFVPDLFIEITVAHEFLYRRLLYWLIRCLNY